jgi:hypothetical protein
MDGNNFLLGKGERLTTTVVVPTGGSAKNPPYDFDYARTRVSDRVGRAVVSFAGLPLAACPGDEAVAALVLHPRYLSKSDFPGDLLTATGLRAIGSRSLTVSPERWGVVKHPDAALSSVLYVAGTRDAFAHWAGELPRWTASTPAARQIVQIEDFKPFEPPAKLRGELPADTRPLLEVVLHVAARFPVVELFLKYAESLGAEPDRRRTRRVGGLAFVPVRAASELAGPLAQFTFVRAVRGMPKLRPIIGAVTREVETRLLSLPADGPLDGGLRVAVLDGGLPTSAVSLGPWASAHEPPNIGAPQPAFQAHGLAVTSSVLFGSLTPNQHPARPFCHVDHIRVLDVNSGADDGLYDVLDRVVEALRNGVARRHKLVNISLGPDMPADDDDVSRWTAEMDELGQTRLMTVAVGNTGEADAAARLNRIQPPSDGVNVLAVGACDTVGAPWKRAAYSSVGPGRSPGLVKPDGVAFGGTATEPFYVLSGVTPFGLRPVLGTSFAAPSVLRAAAGVKAALGPTQEFSPLALRALMIHHAEGDAPQLDTGWGRFDVNSLTLITSEHNEAHVLFQGDLPPGVHLRVPVPLPNSQLTGPVTITATLCIAPGVNTEHASTYTQQGVEICFRPHAGRFRPSKTGKVPAHATTSTFFSEVKLYNKPEFLLREEGKWEPCRRASATLPARSLQRPCFDVYYHHRQDGRAMDPDAILPLPYAMVMTIRADNVADLYNRIVRDYAGQLQAMVPIRPLVQVAAAGRP